MTYTEATEVMDKYVGIAADCEAHILAGEALKEAEEREKGCDYCVDEKGRLLYICQREDDGGVWAYNYCPKCGRRL